MKKYVAVFSIIAVVAVVALAIAITPAFTNATTTSYKSKEDAVDLGPIDIQQELNNELNQEGDFDYSDEATEESNINNDKVIIEEGGSIKSGTLMDNSVNYEDGVITSITSDFKANGTSYKPGYNASSYNITEIKEGVFRNCKKLTEVDLSGMENLKTIGKEAFYGCDNLKVIKLPANITEIGSQAFGNTIWLKERISEATQTVTIVQPDCTIKYEMTGLLIIDGIVVDGHTATGTMTITYTDVTKEPVVVNNILLLDKYKTSPTETNYLDVTKISRNAFSYNTKVQTIGLSNKITDIPYRAFANCTKLATINIPGVKTIGNYAFENCTSLVSVGEINTGLLSIGMGAFKGCESLTTLDIAEVYSSTEDFNIGNQAFMNCIDLDIMYLPRNLKSVGVSAFMGCTSLRRVYFDQNAEGVTLQQSVFKDCTRLRIVDLGKAVTNVPNYTFANCGRLTPTNQSDSGVYVVNPSNVTFGTNGNAVITAAAIHTGSAPVDGLTIDLLNEAQGTSLGLMTGFNEHTFSYEISTTCRSMYVFTAGVADSSVTVKVDGVTVSDRTIDLAVETPKVVKVITKSTTNVTKEYTITITRQDTLLSTIKIKATAESEEYADFVFSFDDAEIVNGQVVYTYTFYKYDEDVHTIYIEVPGVDLDPETEGENGKEYTFDENEKVQISFSDGVTPATTYVLNLTRDEGPEPGKD